MIGNRYSLKPLKIIIGVQQISPIPNLNYTEYSYASCIGQKNKKFDIQILEIW